MRITGGTPSIASLGHEPIGAARPARTTAVVDRLVAGATSVSAKAGAGSDVGASARPAAGGVYEMYTRAAEKNAVATAVHVGRSIDVQG